MKKGIDFIGVGCGALITNEKDKILLLKRGNNVRNESGLWSLPGGTVEFGETRTRAVIREIKEELGCTIEALETLTVVDHFVPKEKQHWVTTIFLCRIRNGMPQNLEPDKCEQIKWFALDEIYKLPLVQYMPAILSSLKIRFPQGLAFLQPPQQKLKTIGT